MRYLKCHLANLILLAAIIPALNGCSYGMKASAAQYDGSFAIKLVEMSLFSSSAPCVERIAISDGENGSLVWKAEVPEYKPCVVSRKISLNGRVDGFVIERKGNFQRNKHYRVDMVAEGAYGNSDIIWE